jgi:hypothetical protein
MHRWELAGFFMRFTIRDLAWLMLVAGLTIAWMVFAIRIMHGY